MKGKSFVSVQRESSDKLRLYFSLIYVTFNTSYSAPSILTPQEVIVKVCYVCNYMINIK